MTVDSVETLVIHPGALGDVLQAVPALAALGRLGNRLTFAGQPRLGELLKGSGVVLAAAPFDTFGLEALFVDTPVSDRLASRLERPPMRTPSRRWRSLSARLRSASSSRR